MRAISSFRREAGISTFWCRAWSAFRTRVSMSATGSVNLIVLLLLQPPVRSAPGGEPAAACYHILVVILRRLLLPPKDLGAPPESFALFANEENGRLARYLTTTKTSKPLESPRATPTAGNTAGRCRTSAEKRAAVRTACSDCACAWKTWAFSRPSLVLL